MQILDIIADLLHTHNCVIVPNFGGFVGNSKAGTFDENRLLSSPPRKKVAFNQSLVETDGLLVREIALRKNVSYDQAEHEVEVFVKFINDRLDKYKNFEFKHLGSFYRNAEGKLIFVAYEGLNFLTKSYGLPDVKVKKLARLVEKDRKSERIQEHIPKIQPIRESEPEKSGFAWGKVAATVSIIALIAFVSWQFIYQGNFNQNSIAIEENLGDTESTAGVLNDLLPLEDETVTDELPFEDITEDVLEGRDQDVDTESILEDITDQVLANESEDTESESDFIEESETTEIPETFEIEEEIAPEPVIEEESVEDYPVDEEFDYTDDESVEETITYPILDLDALNELRRSRLRSESTFYIVIKRTESQSEADQLKAKYEKRAFDAFVMEGMSAGEYFVCLEKFSKEELAERFNNLISRHDNLNAEIVEMQSN